MKVEDINFDWVNQNRDPRVDRLPADFILAYIEAVKTDKKYIDYTTKGGNRFVGRITDIGNLDVIINPEECMLREENKQ